MPDTIKTIAEKRRRWVEANRENNFEAGLKRLLSDLYPDNAHFVYELLQNAEDAQANEVRFILHEDRIEFEHNGKRLFSINNVDAITSIGFSTKRDNPTNIGKFGVGFKSVFAYTETPEIESGKFHFKICDMVVPEADGLPRSLAGSKQTRFVLPFNNPKKKKDRARTEIEVLLRALDATTLLFLTHIRKIEYLLPDSSLGYIERIGFGDNRFEIRVQQPNELAPSSTWFLRFDKEVQVEDEEAEKEDEKVKSCRIAVAFGLSPVEPKAGAKEKKAGGDATPEWELVPMEPGCVCIYFPADKETSNLRFHLHAPFASTVARDSVRDCAGNNELRDHLADLLAESMFTIRDQGLLTVRALAVLPNDKDNLSEFYEPIMDRLVEEFQKEDLVPMKRGGHAAADGIFRGTKALSDLIDDDDMVTLLGDDYVAPIWASNPPQRNQREDNFLSMLGIEQWDTAALVKAVGRLSKDALGQWMGVKADKWHQDLYELLMDYINASPRYPSTVAAERKGTCASLGLVRCSDGTYRKGSNCFFPAEGVEQDDKFPRVAKGVYFARKEENKKAREFLEYIGVSEVDERVEIEAILSSYYTYDSEIPSRKDHYSHLRRFMRFLDENPEQTDLFEEAYLFMVDVEEDIKWVQPEKAYLDAPYMETGLSAYYADPDACDDDKYPLSSVYEKSGIKPESIGGFAKRLGARISLENKDIISFALIFGTETRVLRLSCSRLLWNSLVKLGKNDRHILKDSHRYHKGWGHYGTRYYDSQLCVELRQDEWVPQKNSKKIEFVRPRDAVAEKLPDGFEYQTGWQWLRDLEFGKGVEERREAQKREKEQQSQDYKIKKQVARDLGFESPEEAEEIARMKKMDPMGLQKWRDRCQVKPAFPERASADPERRKSKAVQKAAGAPDKLYEKRERSVRTSRTLGKDGVEEYLRDLYTNDDDQLICQICQDEMPFRKKDGKHYFEKVEAFDLPQEHSANHLALCPVCAAKYDEFVFHGPDDARTKLRRAFSDREDALELPVMLGEETATIRFVETHAIDLSAAIR